VAPESRYATDAEIVGNRLALLERIPPDATVLDVGCWSGSAGRFLQSHRQAVVDGVEPNLEMAAQAATDYRDVFAKSVEEVLPVLLRERTGSYDVVMFLDVLEHLVDPGFVLQQSRQLVRDGGLVLISVPNVAHCECGSRCSEDDGATATTASSTERTCASLPKRRQSN
jgi:2-polyprenyl-3-methyl-5-hydroxy-6-metoxy-1,4-benzoquinol methylase